MRPCRTRHMPLVYVFITVCPDSCFSSCTVWWWMLCRETLSHQRWTMRPDKEFTQSVFSWPGVQRLANTQANILHYVSSYSISCISGSFWLVRACLQCWMMMSLGMARHCHPVRFVMLDGAGDSCLFAELQRSPPTDRCLCLSVPPSEWRRSYLQLV